MFKTVKIVLVPNRKNETPIQLGTNLYTGIAGEFRGTYFDLYFMSGRQIVASTTNRDDIPVIPKSFIEGFLNEFNKGNKIEEVSVETEFYHGMNSAIETVRRIEQNLEYYSNPIDIRVKVNEDGTFNFKGIKVNDDGTISVLPQKETWDRNEVIEKMQSLTDFIDGLYRPYTKENMEGWKALDKWIKENL